MTDTRYILWFRKRYGRWRPIACGVTEAELTRLIGSEGRSGEWLTLPEGERPDRPTKKAASE